MKTMDDSVKGTIFKLIVHMEPIDGHSLEDVQWEAEVYATGGFGKRIVVKKEEAHRIDKDNYIIVVDSSVGGAGHYYLILTAYINDAECPNGIRVERGACDTGVVIRSV